MPPDAVLSEGDFALAREVYGALLPVQNTSLLLEGEQFMGSSVLPLMALLGRKLAEAAPVQVPTRGQPDVLANVAECDMSAGAREFRAALRAELEADLGHLQRSRQTLLCASALDPRWKGLSFATEEERAQVRQRLADEALAAARAALPAPQAPQAQPRLARLRKIPAQPKAKPGMDNLLADLAALQEGGLPEDAEGGTLAAAVSAAVAEWFRGPPLPPGESPLAWWASLVGPGGTLCPTAMYLAPLARKYLCTPGASGTIERLWSDGRRLLAWNRHALREDRVGQLLRLKFNSRSCGAWPPAHLDV